MLLTAVAGLACDPVLPMPLDPGGVGEPPPDDEPPAEEVPPAEPDVPPMEPACVPATPWRRPGGGGRMGGHDADWRPAAVLPEGWNDDGTRSAANTYDDCGRVVETEVWGGCWQYDGCEFRATEEATYDVGGNLLTEVDVWSVPGPGRGSGGTSISHRYDDRGARISTWSVDLDDEPDEPTLAFRFQNDARGRVVREDVIRPSEGFGDPDVALRISTFVYDDALGTITESVDLGADGVVDEVLVH
jgi:hypothetical protein